MASSKPRKGKPMSITELFGGLNEVHRGLAALPGASLVPPEMRAAQRGMTAQQVLDQYSDRGMFGRDRDTGERVRATIHADEDPTDKSRERLAKGNFPADGRVLFYPESHDVAETGNFTITPNGGLALPLGKMTFHTDSLKRPNPKLYPHLAKLYDEASDRYAQSRNSGYFGLRNREDEADQMFPMQWHFGAMDAPSASEIDNPNIGRLAYSAMYDATKAQNSLNFAAGLTGVNKIRRPANVMLHNLGHGEANTVVPLEERGNEHLFGPSAATHGFDDEQRGLSNLLGGDSYLINQALGLRAKDLNNMTSGQRNGYLAMLEAQRGYAYGPEEVRQQGPDYQLKDMVHPADQQGFRDLAVPHVITNKTKYGTRSVGGAIGPSLMQRQAVTEQATQGLIDGRSPQDILDELTNTPGGSFTNTYKRGGAVHAGL